MRSGFFTRPRPLVEFDCGSQSTSRVLTSAAASEAARLMAVVVLPTPPFWFERAMTRWMILFLRVARQDMRTRWRNQCQILVQIRQPVSRETLRSFARDTVGVARLRFLCEVFHVEHLSDLQHVRKARDCNLQREKCFTWNTLVECLIMRSQKLFTTYPRNLSGTG